MVLLSSVSNKANQAVERPTEAFSKQDFALLKMLITAAIEKKNMITLYSEPVTMIDGFILLNYVNALTLNA